MGICYKSLDTWHTIQLFLLIILLCNNASIVVGSSISSSLQRSLQQQNCQQTLEYYSIPPFAVQFTTLDVQDIPAFDTSIIISETDAKASSLTYPLKMATQEFVMSHFREEIAAMNDPAEQLYHDYYQQLTEVELRVVLKHNPKVTDIPGHVALIATMHGTLHFVHRFGCGSATTLVPSQSEVTITFGAWLETLLETKRDEYLQRLLSNQQEMLREIVELKLIPNYYHDSDDVGASWLMVVWVVVGIVGLGCLGFAGMFLMRSHGSIKNLVGSDAHFTDGDDDSALDSKQHGMDISAHRRHSLDVLHKSDEYLSKHRPDLAEGGRRPSVNPLENIMSFFDLSNGIGIGTAPEKTPRSRRSLATRQRSTIELQAGNIAANSEDPSPFENISLNQSNHETVSSEEAIMMAAATQSSSYRPISGIWRSMTSIFRGSAYRENDGIMKNAFFDFDGNEEEYFANLEEERLRDEQWMTFMKEEEKEYNFAFKDFPRKDGTPCLIYNGSSDADEIFTVRSPKGSNNHGQSDILTEREILSDEAFRQLLHMNASPSFEEDSSKLPSSLGYKSPEFNERLSSLFAEKHRQYEKRSIVERHQQKRKKEREMERRERQKDMHRELEALEAGMAMSDKWRAKHHVSPRPYDLSPRAPSYSPKMIHMRSPARPSPARRSPVPITTSIPPRHSSSKSFDLDDITGDSDSVQFIRPRMSRPPAAAPSSDLFVMDGFSSSSTASRYQYSADLDPYSLDRLSMPTMTKNGLEMPPRNPATIHRRVNSTENLYPTLGTIGTTPPRRGMPVGTTRGMSPIRPMTRGVSPLRNSTGTARGISPARAMSPARNSTGTRGMSPARNSTGTRGMSPAPIPSAATTRGRNSVRGLSPKPGPRSGSNSSRQSREGAVLDHGIAALF